MKKLLIIGLLVAFTVACTRPEINDNEFAEYGTPKSKSVTTKGDSQDYDLDNSED